MASTRWPRDIQISWPVPSSVATQTTRGASSSIRLSRSRPTSSLVSRLPAIRPLPAKLRSRRPKTRLRVRSRANASRSVEGARRVTAADDRADRGPGDDVGRDADLVERFQNADMRPAARGAAAERDTDLRPLTLLRIGPLADRRRQAAGVASPEPPATPEHRGPRRPREKSRGPFYAEWRIVRSSKVKRSLTASGRRLGAAWRDRRRAPGSRSRRGARCGRSRSGSRGGRRAPSPAISTLRRMASWSQSIAHLADGEAVAAGIALPPELLPRAAPEPAFAGRDGPGEGLLVHVGDHQHLAGRRIDGDGDDQTVGVEFRHERGAGLDGVVIAAGREAGRGHG